MEGALGLESRHLNSNSNSVFGSFMPLGGYFESLSLSFLTCKMGIIITILLNLIGATQCM